MKLEYATHGESAVAVSIIDAALPLGRGALADLIRQHAHNGKVWLEVWQRDCDCVEWTERRQIAATVSAFIALNAQIGDDADGPFSVSILSQQDAAEWQSNQRDRITEAFENGSTYSV